MQTPSTNSFQLVQTIQERTKLHFINFPSEFLFLSNCFSDILTKFNLRKDGLSPEFIAAVTCCGLLPFCSGSQLSPKLHMERSLISLSKFSLEEILSLNDDKKSDQYQTIKTKKLKKCVAELFEREKKQPDLQFSLIFNQNFEDNLNFSRAKTSSFWISKEYQKSLGVLAQKPFDYSEGIMRMVTSELVETNLKTGQTKILSTDIGYTTGKIYCSMSGATDKKLQSFGILHLIVLGLFLKEKGFVIWDFGMQIEYKSGLGAKTYLRSEFLRVFNFFRKGNIDIGFPNIVLTQLNFLIKFNDEIRKLKNDSRIAYLEMKLKKKVVGELAEKTSKNPIFWEQNDFRDFILIRMNVDVTDKSVADFLGEKPLKFEGISKTKSKRIRRLLNSFVFRFAEKPVK